MNDLLAEQAAELQLDRSNWELVKFGDVAIQQKKAVDRENTELTKYVKGEHMSSEDLHLREWGELTDEYLGPAFIRKFEEDDILYGSRRTYLRKVAIAHFAGITSNTTFVIKANETKIDKRILPYVMLSEGFTEHSIKNSKGSVNPYVNWKDLAGYEFLLPQKEQQVQLAELLWSMDEVLEKHLELSNHHETLLKSILKNKVSTVPSHEGERIKLEERINIKHGFAFKSEFWSEDDLNLPIAVTIGNYDYAGGFRFESTKIKCYSGAYPKEYELLPGDLLLAMTCQTPGGEILGIPGIIADDGRKYLHNQRIGKVEIKSEDHELCRYLYLVFLTSDFRRFIFASASGTKVLHTSPSKIMNYEFRLPSLKYRRCIIKEVDAILDSMKSLDVNIDRTNHLQKSLINQVF